MLRLVSSGCVWIVLVAAGAIPTPAAAQRTAAATAADSGTFTVLHGRDTVASEQFSRTATELHGILTLGGASHGVQQYTAVLAPDATIPLVEVTVRESADSGSTKGRIVQRARVIFKDDSAAVDALTDHGIETRLLATQRGAVPYLNLSFALLEQAVRRARTLQTQPAEVPFFNLGGGQTAVGKFTAVGADSLAFTIGDVEYRLWVDSVGRVLGGGIPKQDVVVKRR